MKFLDKLLHRDKDEPISFPRQEYFSIEHTNLKSNTYKDELIPQCIDIVVEKGQASTSLLQIRLKLGYTHAARLMDEMEEMGIIGPYIGATPRTVLITRNQWENELKHNIYYQPVVKENTDVKKASMKYDVMNLCFDYMSGEEFEHFCAELLKENKFTNVRVTQASGDYGIDILAEKDYVTYAIQCKCYSSNIGNHAVQEAFSGKEMYKCMVGVVMTNQYFTPAAKKTAEDTRILLWDRDVLIKMIGTANLNIKSAELSK